jgi:succinate dehydrogenase / fumarate reductase, cytochrome b subunit
VAKEQLNNPLALTSVGTKMLIAVTGIALVLFVLAHMIGNLQVFAGRDSLNAYATKLKSLGPLLWVARIALVCIFSLHVGLTLKLSRSNHRARGAAVSESPLAGLFGERYINQYHYKAATTSARFMILSGLLILLFIAYHLAHFTFHQIGDLPSTGVNGEIDVYEMVVQGFQNTWISVSYILFQLVLGLHIYHGFSSAIQTLGLRLGSAKAAIGVCGPALAALITCGNVSIPLAVWVGFI